MQERRKNVRVRPAADYDIQVDYEEGLVSVQLSVIDVAVGGVGLVIDKLFAHLEAKSEILLGITLPDFSRFQTTASVRYAFGGTGGRCGIHFPSLSEEEQTALSKAVSELLERGHSV